VEHTVFSQLLRELTECIEDTPQERGRPRLDLKELIFCAVLKVYSQNSSRRAHSLYSDALTKGYIRKVPNYNAINKVLNLSDLTPVIEKLVTLSSLPLREVETGFAVDSTGFRTTCFTPYAHMRYHVPERHGFLKAHVCVGVKTNIITSVRVTDYNDADSPQFAGLLQTTKESGFSMQQVLADKAYSSRKNLEIAAECGAVPFIPFRSNTTGKSRGSSTWRKMYLYFSAKQEEFMAYYHKRSNVESTFAAIKKKLGDTLKSKNFIAQKNELLCKILAYNITVLIREMYEIGIRINTDQTNNQTNNVIL
jgi:transposase